MKILVSKEEVQEVRAIADVLLKSQGINALAMANKILESVNVEDNVPQEGEILKKDK